MPRKRIIDSRLIFFLAYFMKDIFFTQSFVPYRWNVCSIAFSDHPRSPSYALSKLSGVSNFNVFGWLWRSPKLMNGCITSSSLSMVNSTDISRHKVIKTDHINRIAIIGGGICGVTAAKAILTRMKTLAPDKHIEIQIYEADSNSYEEDEAPQKYGFQNGVFPSWKAATARNANSMVPAAAMHIMSQRDDLLQIIRDSLLQMKLRLFSGSARERDFSTVPPYFAFSPTRCLGLSASWPERKCFANFVYHFMTTSLMTGEEEAKKRGKIMVQLAQANRVAIEKETQLNFDSIEKVSRTVASLIGLQNGFISVHRTMDKAKEEVEECIEYNEKAELLSKEEAIRIEPKIADVPFEECYCVHRIYDQTGNCLDFIRNLIKGLKQDGVVFSNKNGEVKNITVLDSKVSHCGHNIFEIRTRNGDVRHYDRVILAAGIYTPLLAAQISSEAGRLCPIYPLKGYSLTVFTKPRDEKKNFLSKPLSFDNIYCSSVAPNMVRLAGFGEIVGFPKGDKIEKSDGPDVLEKYALRIFGRDANHPISNTTLPCYRPLSPDDCPLVGRFDSTPGLYVHTGHGTLGWTTSLATAMCLAQDICDDILGQEEREEYILPDGSFIDKSVLSPGRFKIF